jgi:hypothetical protein
MSDLSKLSDQDLRDIERAADLAVRQINVMSETASRFISLEKRAAAELRRRRGLHPKYTRCDGTYADFQGADRRCLPGGEGCGRDGCTAAHGPMGGW